MTREPSGLKAALFIQNLCPASVATATPVSASQARAVVSRDAGTTREPSGLNEAPFTKPGVRPRQT